MATGRHSATLLYRFSLGLGGRQRDERVRWVCQSTTLPAPRSARVVTERTPAQGRVPDVVFPSSPHTFPAISGIKLLRIEF